MNENHGEGGRFAAADRASALTRLAGGKTAAANKANTASSHREAAKAHFEAADAHQEAASASKDPTDRKLSMQQSSDHRGIGQQHQSKAKELFNEGR